jgi:hypothetical protein
MQSQEKNPMLTLWDEIKKTTIKSYEMKKSGANIVGRDKKNYY